MERSKIETTNPVFIVCTAMNYISSTIRIMRNADLKMLGRWTINYGADQIKTKVHQANTDHCGVCDIAYLQENTRSKSNELVDVSKSKYMTAVKQKVKERKLSKKLNGS